MAGNFDDAVKKLNGERPTPRLVCPLCGEKRLEKLLPKGDGLVWCSNCADEFHVKP